ncbi:MAG TPA: hypothetical protein ENF43_02875 [Thermoplasmatales archaeon]|nr:hypothetical protein [Thermoplasmatales archaeon]
MEKKKTHLVTRVASDRLICTYCGNVITPGQRYYREEGVDFHLHSLIARNYCEDCYKKYGEEILIK